MQASASRDARFGPLSFRGLSTFAGGQGPFDVLNFSVDAGTNYNVCVGFDTTSKQTHEPIRGYCAPAASTARHYFYCDVPPGMTKVEKIVARAYAGTPTTDAVIKVGVYDHSSVGGVLYTSASQSLKELYSATDAPLTYAWTPGALPAAFALTPYDLAKATGKTTLVGFIQVCNPVNSTIWMHQPTVFFKSSAGKRQ